MLRRGSRSVRGLGFGGRRTLSADTADVITEGAFQFILVVVVHLRYLRNLWTNTNACVGVVNRRTAGKSRPVSARLSFESAEQTWPE